MKSPNRKIRFDGMNKLDMVCALSYNQYNLSDLKNISLSYFI